MADTLRITTSHKKQVVDLTDRVNTVLRNAKVQEGLCVLFLTHTTAALTTGEVGEGTDEDLLEVVERFIPPVDFQHAHNPAHAWSHMASSILGPSLAVPVAAGELVLGTWQSVLLVELDGPKERHIHIRVVASG